MGSAFSCAFDLAPPFKVNAPPESGDLDAAEEKKEKEKSEWVHCTKLPCPIPYQDLHKQADQILMKTDTVKPFEGMKILVVKNLNERFSVGHYVTMETIELPDTHEIRRVSNGSYAFCTLFNDPKVILFGKIFMQGTLDAHVRCNFTNNLTCKIDSQLANEPDCSCSTVQFDYKGESYQSRFQIDTDGVTGVYGAKYIKSVTQSLSLGSELSWWGDVKTMPMFGFGAQYKANKMIANGQVMSDGSFQLSYIKNLSEKVSLASEFIYKHSKGEVISSFGYHYKFRKSLLWGKVDSNAVVSSYLEREIGTDTKLLVSAEIDHAKKNYKFGYGLEFGRDRPELP